MKYFSKTLKLEMATATDVGQVRQRNEDEVRILPEAGAVVLADGMGGHQAGDEASRLAVDIVAEQIHKSDQVDTTAMTAWIEAANQAIRELARTNAAFRGMGATIVVAVCRDDTLLFGHVGDSRLYRLWDNALHQLTEDHTLVQRYINEGMISAVEGKSWAGRNLLTKGLGIEDIASPTCGQSSLYAGQTYLLCSDGLTDPVTDDEITEILSNPGLSADDAANELVDLANANGGPDNISVAIIRIHEA